MINKDGNAYRILFEEASGDYIVMGDGDFRLCLSKFLNMYVIDY